MESKRRTVLVGALRCGMGEEVVRAVRSAGTVEELEALYEPFKGSKRSAAKIAEEKGYLPVGEAIFTDDMDRIRKVLGQFPGEEEEAREGGIAIAAEKLFQCYNKEEFLRMEHHCVFSSAVREDPDLQYKEYHAFSRSITQVKGYQYLAIARGREEKKLKASIQFTKSFHCFAEKPFSSEKQQAEGIAQKRVAKLGERVFGKRLKEKAEEEAILSFRKNLREKLLIPPLKVWDPSFTGDKIVIALDPGFKHGTKVAVCDQHGNVISTSTIYNLQTNAKQQLQGVIRQYNPYLVCVGNGHGSLQIGELLKLIFHDRISGTLKVN